MGSAPASAGQRPGPARGRDDNGGDRREIRRHAPAGVGALERGSPRLGRQRFGLSLVLDPEDKRPAPATKHRAFQGVRRDPLHDLLDGRGRLPRAAHDEPKRDAFGDPHSGLSTRAPYGRTTKQPRPSAMRRTPDSHPAPLKPVHPGVVSADSFRTSTSCGWRPPDGESGGAPRIGCTVGRRADTPGEVGARARVPEASASAVSPARA